jgi:cyclase
MEIPMARRKLLLPLACAASLSAACTDALVIDDKPQTFAACEDREFPLEEPVAGRAWTPNAITLKSEKVADGVFVVYDQNASEYGPAGVPLATTGGFVVGDRGVLLVESMINRRLFCQVIDLIRAETDKPLRYVVNTSHHGDHSYGNHFLPDGVQVVQHENTAAFIGDSEKFAADVAFMEMNFGADQGIDEVRARAADILVDEDGWSIDLGGVRVDALYLGFGQTDGDLFVHVPSADLLFLGNPVVAQAPAIPWLLDGHAQEVARTLKHLREKFSDATLVPGHDAPQSARVLDFPIDYLDALLAATQRAVDAGQTVEEASASVTLDDYQGYALWDWVHKSVNVPATFAELSE